MNNNILDINQEKSQKMEILQFTLSRKTTPAIPAKTLRQFMMMADQGFRQL